VVYCRILIVKVQVSR